MEDRRQRRARVFRIDVDVAGPQRAVADERAAEIQLARDRECASRFERLRQQFAEDDLFGEILGPDDDRIGCGPKAVRDENGNRIAPVAARTKHRRALPLLTVPAGAAPLGHVSSASAVSASSAAGIAPARIIVESTIDRPRKMYSPSPPRPDRSGHCGRARRRSPWPPGCRRRSTAVPVAVRPCRSSWPLRHAHGHSGGEHRAIDARQSGDCPSHDRQQRVEDQCHDRHSRARRRRRTAAAAETPAAPGSESSGRRWSASGSSARSRGRRAATIPAGTPMRIANDRRNRHQHQVPLAAARSAHSVG